MAQFLRPNSDLNTRSWQVPPLFSKINEAVADDSSKATHSNSVPSTVYEMRLSSATTPATATDHFLRVRLKSTSLASVPVVLYCGAVLVTSRSAVISSGTWTTFTFTLTSPEIALITDYTDLRLFVGSDGGGMAYYVSTIEFSWAELEVPDGTPPPVVYNLVSVAVNPGQVNAGTNVTGTVSMDQVAPVGGLVVNLSSDKPVRASVPATVTVPEAALSADFTVTVPLISSPDPWWAYHTDVVITATYDDDVKTDSLRIMPPTAVDYDADARGYGWWRQPQTPADFEGRKLCCICMMWVPASLVVEVDGQFYAPPYAPDGTRDQTRDEVEGYVRRRYGIWQR